MVDYNCQEKGGGYMKNGNPSFKISLKACRANADLTQKEMAKLVGVKADTIKNWERGKSSPKSTQFQKISEICHIPMDFIFLPK